MCQFEPEVTDYLTTTKELYKDLVVVAKDPDTKEVRPQSIVLRVEKFQSSSLPSSLAKEHP